MRHGALALAGLIAACGGAPGQHEREPSGATENSGGGAATPELRGAPLALGSWTFREMGSEAAALFGPPASEATFLIRCAAQLGQVHFLRAGSLPGGEGAMTIVAGDARETLPARAATTQIPQIEAVLPAGAPLVAEALARGPERIGVSLGDGSMLVMPGGPAVARALQRCAGR